MKRFSILSAMIAALITCSSSNSSAETWVPATGAGVWNVGTNWTPATFPNAAGAIANFNTGTGNRTYTYGQAITVGAMNIDNNSNFTNIFSIIGPGLAPMLTFDSGSTAPATITVTGSNGGAAQSNIIRGDVTLNSNLVVSNPVGTSSAAGTFGFQNGAISGPGGITKNGDGVFTFADAGDKAYTGPTIINAGRFRLNNAAKVTATSSILVNSGGQLDLEGAFDYTLGPGAITLNGFGLFNAPAGNFPGAIRTGSGLLQYIENNIVLASDASIDVVSGPAVSPQGKLNLVNEVSGPGRLIANQKAGLISREGVLILLHSNTYTGGTTIQQGTLTVSDLLATHDASLGTGSVYADGVTPAADFNPDGAASGKLSIEAGITNAIADTAYLNLSGGGTAVTPDRGAAILGAGINETVGGLMLGGVIQGAGTYGSTASSATFQSDEFFGGTGIITVVPAGVPGDYNNNGVVDAGDYVVWKKGGPLANDFTPGVQSTDYDFWRSRFGATTNPGSGTSLLQNAPVPEPSTIALIGCLFSLLTLGHRRKSVLNSLRELNS